MARLLHGPQPQVLPAIRVIETSPMHDYDMIVIGSGPSGRRAAVQFAKLGRSVLVVEKGRRVGGVSVHTGTIPSKTLRETVLNLSGWRERGFYGRSYRVKQEIGAADLMARLQKTLDHEVEVLEHQFSRNMVRTALGEARFVGPNQIEITAGPQRRAATRRRRQFDRADRKRATSSPNSPTAATSPRKCCCSRPAGSAPPTGSTWTPPASWSTTAAASRSIR
ncbi:hypothetical protein V1282_004055 [Nitrobacteraceae bacterium AZCC 2146]